MRPGLLTPLLRFHASVSGSQVLLLSLTSTVTVPGVGKGDKFCSHPPRTGLPRATGTRMLVSGCSGGSEGTSGTRRTPQAGQTPREPRRRRKRKEKRAEGATGPRRQGPSTPALLRGTLDPAGALRVRAVASGAVLGHQVSPRRRSRGLAPRPPLPSHVPNSNQAATRTGRLLRGRPTPSSLP